ncbi:AbgT family transporter [Georgenia sp. TF02-10]|uniref:YfcC family protein n=1 Tax=Georgenia sp. TF02-10 TaxID=2917725 RepID=UPI001FA7B77F|nr:AbgT family transporter [Georgenia sp. TF02-10]UNX53171.1 AbgT family transporter [Georgenia sp. TF02-10]
MLTYAVPGGRYERVAGPGGRELVDPDSFQSVASTPTTLLQLVTAIPRGVIDASQIVFFVLVVGGMFAVIRRTGVVDLALGAAARRFADRGILVIPALMLLFSLIASLIGVPELSLVYIPAIMPLILALGFDRVTAVATALVGTGAGFAAGFLNPINTGLGQQIAGLPPFSGLSFRVVVYLALISAGIAWTMAYAARVRSDPARSFVADVPVEDPELAPVTGHGERMSHRQRLAALAMLPFVGVLVWGLTTQGWLFVEMAGLFLVMAVVVGLVAGLSTRQIAEGFDAGARDVLGGALIVGFARAVALVLEDGQILDTIVNGLGTAVDAVPPVLTAIAMLILQALFNLIVPSGSGQAVVTLPILAPLSDLVGVTRQTTVLAYQLGDGMTNLIYPTSGYFMAAIAVGRVPWQRWVRFYLPLLGIWLTISIVALIIAQAIGWN